jgi:flagellar motor switch protein FliN/FliY
VATDFKTILNLTVPMIVRIGHRKLPLSEVLALGPGSIIELSKSADETLDLQVNNKSVGTGSAVKVGENFGIRIAEINSARSRAEALVGE